MGRCLGSPATHVLRSQVNAITFLSNGLLATAAGKQVALWDVNACTIKQQLNHEGAVRVLHAPARCSTAPRSVPPDRCRGSS